MHHRIYTAILSVLLPSCTSSPSPPEVAPRAAVPEAQVSTRSQVEVQPPKPRALEPAQPVPLIDLEADRERVLARIHSEIGSRARTKVVAERFILASPAGTGTVETAAPFVERVLEALFNNRFRTRPQRALAVYLFSEATSYNRYCREVFKETCISIYGFFSPQNRSLVMNIGLGIGTLSHELVHPILEADFPQAPTWINEGIASLYEAPVLPKRGEIHGARNWRFPRLRAALSSQRERSLATLPALFNLTDEQFRAQGEDLHYAMARYTCQWLDEQGRLWAFYQRWRDNYAADPKGEVAFTEVLGRTPAEANSGWVTWVKRLGD